MTNPPNVSQGEPISSGLLAAEQVLAVGQKLVELHPLNQVLEAVVEATASAMRADTAMVLLREGDPKKPWNVDEPLAVAAQKCSDPAEPRTVDAISTSLLEGALRDGKPVITESAVGDPRFSGKSSIILQRIHAAIIVPLISPRGTIGAIYLDSRSDRTLFHQKNLQPLCTLSAFATLAIENARRYEKARRSSVKGQASSLVGSAPVMQELYGLIERVASSDLPVLVLGESGTGKELIAREVHERSPRSDKRFVALYCGNVAPQLFESELFGHKKGSFTGATSDKPGLVQEAEGGTLFLDEVADIPGDMQTKLLRFLQEGEYRAVGDVKIARADVRIVAATNKDLRKEVQSGRFREDLFYRLYILPIVAPALRDRLADIPFLVRHFLDKYGAEKRNVAGISPEALRLLMNHAWPGNVRELENTIARAIVVARGERIETEDILLPQVMSAESPEDLSWKAAERQHILKVLSQCNGNKSRAAEVLGISRRYLHYRLKEWGAERDLEQ